MREKNTLVSSHLKNTRMLRSGRNQMRTSAYWILIFLFLCGQASLLIAQDFLDTIAIQSCACIDDYSATHKEQISEVQFGLCIIDRASPYSEKLMEQYNIDMSAMEGENARALGEIVAVRMLKQCPEYLIALSEGSDKESTIKIEGSIKDIAIAQFTTLIVIDEAGRNYSLLWLRPFDGSELLMRDKVHLIGTHVMVDYEEQEFFDPQIQEYRKYKVITGLQMP